ncbi:prolyl oligopeptidase family serine peptidase [Streptomyces sp. NPDC059900]|uniref:alpha/beta hydrolase family protein n=1 Tax=Streptomyces sp. NPDC059900 TaxID=3155816 RepID=UPI00342C87BA
MPFLEAVFSERQKHLLTWQQGPVLAHMQEDGTLRIGPVQQKEGASAELDLTVDGDAILYTQSTESFTCFRLHEHRLEVTEHSLDGAERVWTAALPTAPAGQWTIHDVIECRTTADNTCFVLTVTDEEDGNKSLLWVAEDAATRIHRPRARGQAVHWSPAGDAVVLQEERGPLRPLLHIEPLNGGATAEGCTTEAQWLDGHHDQALVLTDAPEEPRLAHWDLRTGQLQHIAATTEPVSSSRFFRAVPSRALVITAHEGRDHAYHLDLASGDMKRMETPGAGRLLPKVTALRGIGLYGLSTTEGTSYWWIEADGSVQRAPGAVQPAPRLTAPRHTYFAATPGLIYQPPDQPRAAVISLHGGPESQERDELRWDGLYRDLLHARVGVIGLNYTGSSGYGSAFLRQPWKNWAAAFQKDLDACLAAILRNWGIPPARTALLGGSFGGSLALLGCTLIPRIAGAVASAPLTDIRNQAARAARDDERYASWFSDRYNLNASLPHHRTFAPENLTRTGAKQRIVVIHGKNDQVTSYEDSAATVARGRQQGLPWSLIADASGHVPENAHEARHRYEQVQKALTGILSLQPNRTANV